MSTNKTKVKKQEDRERWLVAYIAKLGDAGAVDVLNLNFVDAYVAATGATEKVMMFGANKCRMLGADLSKLESRAILKRCRVGLSGMVWGFPKWVWSYRLDYNAKYYLPKEDEE